MGKQSKGKTKQTLRSQVLQFRSQLSMAEVKKLSRRISLRVSSMKKYQEAENILFYAAFRNEVDTWEILQHSCAAGKNVCLPRTYPTEKKITAVQLKWDGHTLTNLTEGPYGILEPRGPECDAGKLDLVFVPGAAFDKCGYRIGYGGGYYDRFLSGIASSIQTVGLCFSFQLLGQVPHEQHDIPLSYIVTDSSVINADLIRGSQLVDCN